MSFINQRCALIAWAGITGVLSGCSDDVVGSKDVATSEMYADLNVWSYGEQTILVTATLKKGGSGSTTYIDLEGGDRRVVSLNTPLSDAGANGDLFGQLNTATHVHKVMNGGPEVEEGIPLLFPDYILAAPYRARFDVAKDGDTFIVALERAEANDAPNSRVVLPESFSFITPASGANIPRSADLMVSWSPVQSAASVTVNAAVDCLTGFDGVWSQSLVSDTGTVIIPAGTFTDPTSTCDLLIIVDRYFQGAVDANYGGGGTILAHQSRFVTAKSVP